MIDANDIKTREMFSRNGVPIEKSGLSCKTPSRTKQSFKKECDLNHILATYKKNGISLKQIEIAGKASSGVYGDFSDVPQYREALERVSAAHDAFMQLPASVRSRFDNDPAAFLEFATNPANGEEMVKMGLAKKVQVSAPAPASGEVKPDASSQSKPEGKGA